MQIDFHHAVTYIVARHAGFADADARIIAYAAQYVDDATTEGILCFDNGGHYSCAATAHRMLDYRNFEQLASARVWLPFHFLPGNNGHPDDHSCDMPFVDRILCRPGSYVAEDMVRACLDDGHRPYRLHRLGITAHVLVDTWAHQGFAGVPHKINELRELRDAAGHRAPSMVDRVLGYFGDAVQTRVAPTGHGRALSYPDRPWLKWRYLDGLGREVARDNPIDFTLAADAMCRLFRRALLGRPDDAGVPGLAPKVRQRIADQLACFTDLEPEDRHTRWLESIAAGKFGFPGVYLTYTSTGPGSWWYEVFGDVPEEDEAPIRYDPRFLTSNWKRFHDAAKAHRREVIDDILPRYGIVAA